MRANYRVVLDACVLIPMPLADTLLRFAETPRLYLPMWTEEIMSEVTRNLISKFEMPAALAERREKKIREAFPESLVDGYEPLIDKMENDPKDRHVLAAAVRSRSELIVTCNTKHFPVQILQRWQIEAQGPSTFSIGLYDLDPALAFASSIVKRRVSPFESLLPRLRKAAPSFVDYLCSEQGIQLPA